MFSTRSWMVMPMGTSTSPVLLTLPTRENTFVPLDPLVPKPAYHDDPFSMIIGHVVPGLHVVEHRRLVIQPFFNGADVLCPRFAHLSFQRPHERRGLAAHERAAASADLDVEIEIGTEDVLPEKAHFARGMRGRSGGFSRRGDTRPARRCNPWCAPTAYPPMIIPSITECGSPSMMERSMNAPGSPSSPLHIT